MGLTIDLYRIGKPNGRAWTGVETHEFLGCVNDEFGWDGLNKYSGDREIASLWGEEDGRMINECDPVSRPIDIEFARQQFRTIGYNDERWEQLCDILRDNPDVWVYFAI